MGHIKHFPWKPVWTGWWTQPRDWSRFLTPWETDWQWMRPHRRRSFASGGKGRTHSKTQVFQRWGGSVRPFVARQITTATVVSTIKVVNKPNDFKSTFDHVDPSKLMQTVGLDNLNSWNWKSFAVSWSTTFTFVCGLEMTLTSYRWWNILE